MKKDTTKTNSDGTQNRPQVIPAEVRNRLERKLLSFGGSSVIWQGFDPQAALVANKGHIFDQRVRMKRGIPHRCHENAAELWALAMDKYQLVTGYGLSGDKWFAHSWVVDGKYLYETTGRLDRYFGVKLEPLLAHKFWFDNFYAHYYLDREPSPGFWQDRPGIVALFEAAAQMPKEEFYRQFEECSHGLCA